jgi:hypothetical protein
MHGGPHLLPQAWKVEAGGYEFKASLGLHSKILSQKQTPPTKKTG